MRFTTDALRAFADLKRVLGCTLFNHLIFFVQNVCSLPSVFQWHRANISRANNSYPKFGSCRVRYFGTLTTFCPYNILRDFNDVTDLNITPFTQRAFLPLRFFFGRFQHFTFGFHVFRRGVIRVRVHQFLRFGHVCDPRRVFVKQWRFDVAGRRKSTVHVT